MLSIPSDSSRKNIERIDWKTTGNKNGQFRQKFDHSTDLFIKNRILPAKLTTSKIFATRLKAGQNKRTNQIITRKESEKGKRT